MGKNEISAIDRIRANINNEQQSKIIESWSNKDDDFIVYWTPITLADKQKIQRNSKGDDQLTTAYTFIFKCTDKEGNKLFDIGDKRALMNDIGSREIEAVALEILGINDEVMTPEK